MSKVVVEVEISVKMLKELFRSAEYQVKDAAAFDQLISTPAFKKALADDIFNTYYEANQDNYGDAFESFADVVLSDIPEAEVALEQLEYN